MEASTQILTSNGVRNDKTFDCFSFVLKISRFLPFWPMFWSRDFSSDDNRDPVYLHASNPATRDVRDDVDKCASAKRA